MKKGLFNICTTLALAITFAIVGCSDQNNVDETEYYETDFLLFENKKTDSETMVNGDYSALINRFEKQRETSKDTVTVDEPTGQYRYEMEYEISGKRGELRATITKGIKEQDIEETKTTFTFIEGSESGDYTVRQDGIYEGEKRLLALDNLKYYTTSRKTIYENEKQNTETERGTTTNADKTNIEIRAGEYLFRLSRKSEEIIEIKQLEPELDMETELERIYK